MLGELWRRLWYLLNRSRLERELREEMAAHREMMGDPTHFGNALGLREASRDEWGWRWLDELTQDVRHAVRLLRRAPGFTLAACIILALGIGLNLTFFHVLNVTALRPPAVADPQTLVRFHRRSPTMFSNAFPYPATEFIRQHNDAIAAVLTQFQSAVVWEDDGDRVPAAFVSANWFRELGYGAALGRVLDPPDEVPDAPPVAVISHAFWHARLHGAPDVVGRTVRINDRPVTIVGVAPAAFPGLRQENPRVWLPIAHIGDFNPGSDIRERWDTSGVAFYARLRPGVSPDAAADALGGTMRGLADAHPQHVRADEWLEPVSALDRFRGPGDRRELLVTTAAIGGLTLLVLLVASANLGNLVLSKAIGRLREISIRTAVGASRTRLLRQLLVENALLAIVGAVVAGGLAWWGAALLARVTELPAYHDLTPDWRLLAAACACALVAMLAFGAVPTWMVCRRDLAPALKDGGQQATATLSRVRFRRVLIGLQVAGCCAVLVTAAAVAQSLQRLLAADWGFQFERVATLDASLGRIGLEGAPARAYWDEVRRTVALHPEVEHLALVSPSPLADGFSSTTYVDAPELQITMVKADPAFFDVMEIPILSGRAFAPADDHRSVTIVSRRLALTLHGTTDVVGRDLGSRTIIGVAGDAPFVRLRGEGVAEQYMPLGPDDHGQAVLVVRARTDPSALLQPMHRAARTADSRVLPMPRLLRAAYDERLRAPRLASLIAGLTGALVLALALACVGIAGVVGHAVAVRTKEIGIRRALGAGDVTLMTLVLRQLTWPLTGGLVIGMLAGLLAITALEQLPFLTGTRGIAAPLVALSIFCASAFAAALLPSLRALRVDPVHALRHE